MEQLSLPCPALRTHPVVQRNHPAACGACPARFFFQQIRFNAQRLPPPGIFHQADRVTLAIAAVEPFDHRTGKIRAFRAERRAVLPGASLDLAHPAVIGLRAVHCPAAPAGLFLAQMHITHQAVHAAWG